MTRPEQPLSEFLRRLRAELDVLDPASAEELARHRIALEWVATTLPAPQTDARRLVLLGAEALHQIESGGAADDRPRRLVSALRGAASAVAEHLDHPDDFGRELLLVQAGQQLLAALGRDAADWLAARPAETAPSAEADDILSLDEAATLLMMVEPGERDELRRVHTALDAARELAATPEPARAHVTAAHAALSRLLDGPAATIEALAEVARLVGEAVAARDEADVAGERNLPSVDALPDGDRDLIAEFIVEAREYLESAESALLALEAHPADAEAINTVFRAFHTVKGTSGFLGLDAVARFAHQAESLFSRVRDGELPFAGRVPDLALRALDVVKGLLAAVERALAGETMGRPAEYELVLRELVAAAVEAEEQTVSRETASPVAGTTDTASPPAPASPAAPPERRTPAPAAREDRSAAADASIRVRTDRLDRLIDMVGELVIAQTMVAQDATVQGAGHHGLSRKVGHAGKIVRELHDLSLSMRMVPLRPVFQKMTRLVRDVAHGIGKSVVLVTDGEETEIDRTMVDALGDPLVHMVRNAVDHGIEPAQERLSLGKPATGTVWLSAAHSGGSVVVELRDDGRGLDPERIFRKAVAKGLVDPSAKLTEQEIYTLIFAPGFSTAEQVTDVSGRGVGMDVVRRNIETLRGRVEISSRLGEGTTFTIRLPLTLAVTDGMLVRVGRERYVVPITSIFMSFRPEPGALFTVAGRGEMVRLRDDVMPLFRLHRLFAIEEAVEEPTRALVVVVSDGDDRAALLVDELLGQQQVVAKSLGQGIGTVPGVSGGAILGDGRVGLILDVAELLLLVRRGDTPPETLRSVA